MRKLPLILLFSLFLTACFSGSKAPSLNGTAWSVATIVDGDSTINIAANEAYIDFTPELTFNAHTPCNSIGGVFTTSGNDKIEITTQTSTMALCPDIAYESALIMALEETKFFVIDGNELLLKDGDGRAIIKLSEKR